MRPGATGAQKQARDRDTGIRHTLTKRRAGELLQSLADAAQAVAEKAGVAHPSRRATASLVRGRKTLAKRRAR